MTRLSVNLNKIALLRNSRHTGVPDLAPFVLMAQRAGAHGITVHPRPDARHIRRTDVDRIADLMAPYRPSFEYNIEGRPDPAFMDIVETIMPEQVTLVPDAPAAFTSEKGWDLSIPDMDELTPIIRRLKAIGSRVILFVDPDPTVPERARDVGADGIEIYTGDYAAAHRSGAGGDALAACIKTGQAAHALHMCVNAGHDLNRHNLPDLVAGLPFLHEVSIGHELTADALVMGFEATIGAYLAALGHSLSV